MDPRTASFVRYREHGDLDSLGRLFDAVAPELLGVALHLTGNAADAEDALQATFVVAMRKAQAFEARGSVTAWLSGILTGEANNLRRREGRRRGAPMPPEVAAQLPADGAVGGVDEVERRELVAQLRTHIDALPDEQRQVLLLQLQHGLQPAEIAEVLGVAPGTVRMRIHRGLAALRRVLPASLATLAITTLAPRGLAAIKADVMAAAAAQAAAVTMGTATVGGLAMKKFVLGLFAAAAAWWIWWMVVPPANAGAPDGGQLPEPARAHASAGLDGEGAADGGADRDAAAAAAQRAPVEQASGSIDVVVRADQALVTNAFLTEVESSDGSGEALVGVLVEAWAGLRHDGPLDGRLVRARTDRGGAARFASLPAGPWRFAVYAGGLRLTEPRTFHVEGGGRHRFEVHVVLGGTVSGRVVDARGASVPDAEIWVGNRVGDLSRPAQLVRLAGRSDGSGRFRISHAPLEELVVARKAGLASSRAHPVQQLGGGDVVLELGSAAGAIAGRVTDEHGKPLAGVPVAAQEQRGGLRRTVDGTLVGPRLPVVVRTDDDGRFHIGGLPEGPHQCFVRRPPDKGAERLVRVTAGGVQRTSFVMERRVALFGTVRDQDGRPLHGVYVMVTYEDRSSSSLPTAADGSFRFEGIQDRAFELVAMRMATRTKTTRSFSGLAGRSLQVDLTIEDPPPLRVRVQSESGRSLVGWVVALDGDRDRGVRTASVRDSGVASLWRLGPGQHRVSLFRSKADVEGTALATGQGKAGETITLTVADAEAPGATVRGRLVDEQRRPLADAWAYMPASPVFEEPGVAADGRFEFADLSAGNHRLQFGAEGRAQQERQLQLREGEERDLGDLVVARSGTLRVRYLRPDGTPWTGRPPMPWLRSGHRILRKGYVDYAVDGDEVVVTRIPAGDYVVVAPMEDELVIAPVPLTIAPGATRHLTLDVRVGRTCSLAFDGDGDDSNLQVTVRSGNGDVVFEQGIGALDGDAYELRAMLPLGPVVIEAVSEAGRRYRLDYRVRPEQRADVPVRVAHVP